MQIKLIIFDLDGVLIDAKEIHYEAFNKALKENGLSPISREDHISKYDGLSTTQKLLKLGVINVTGVNILKQKYTSEEIKKLKTDYDKLSTLNKLKNEGYTIAVASNSIRNTVKEALIATDLIRAVDFYLSNEDVKHPKPSSEIYLEAMIKAGVSPKETLIIEDSYNGRLAADKTGALIMGVNSPSDITYDNIKNFLDKSEGKSTMKWKDPKLNIVIPMAGLGSRFAEKGYIFPKPLIEVHGKPMIQAVVENLNIEANYIFIVQKEHYDKYNLKSVLNLIAPGCKIIIKDTTEIKGAAFDILRAKEHINNDAPLVLANSDQFLEWDSSAFMYSMAGDYVDGGIVTFTATHPKWSFAKTNDHGFVTEVAEKNPISDIATAGIYYWKKGSDFVKYAKQMIVKGIKLNGEYYTCPVFNEAIQDSKRIKTYHIDKMWGIGTPQDLEYFIQNYKEDN